MIKKNEGFTLSETLVTVILVVLMSGAIAIGIHVVNRTLKSIQTKANAQVLLSTTITLISDDLKYATDVNTTLIEGQTLIQSDDHANVYFAYSSDGNGIMKTYYTEQLINGSIELQESGTETIVTAKAQTEELSVSLGNITYENHIFTIQDLKITNSETNQVLEELQTFSIVPLNING